MFLSHRRFSLSLSVSLPLSLKAMKKCPQVRIKKFKKKGNSNTFYMNCEDIMLSEINWSQKDKYCVIPLR